LRSIATLPGAHNWQNAAAAYAVSRALGMDAATIAGRMAGFPGLAHRQELVATIGGVRYVNDSKATNGAAAARALACYETIHWIAGGVAKEDGLAPVTPYLGHVAHAYLIGEAAARFEAELAGRVPVTRCNDLASALRAAHLAAREPGAVVLLSPACASFDQWPNFARRGDAFRDIVERLAEGAS
jgi:UDP-N-acetylmuramoylalanine--D-glutamate ligase